MFKNVCVCTCPIHVHTHTCMAHTQHSIYVEVRGQPEGADSLLQWHVPQKWNSGLQAWLQASLPTMYT